MDDAQGQENVQMGLVMKQNVVLLLECELVHEVQDEQVVQRH